MHQNEAVTEQKRPHDFGGDQSPVTNFLLASFGGALEAAV